MKSYRPGIIDPTVRRNFDYTSAAHQDPSNTTAFPQDYGDIIAPSGTMASVIPTPANFLEATSHPIWGEMWTQACNNELAGMNARGSITEILVPAATRTVGTTWNFRVKELEDGTLDKLKARWCGQGYRQIKGVDYDKSSSPCPDRVDLFSFLAIAAEFGLEVEQYDFVAAFLQADLGHPILVDPPPFYRRTAPHGYKAAFELSKALYGLKDAGRRWFEKLAGWLKSVGFEQCPVSPCVFRRGTPGGPDFIITILHVDDGLVGGASKAAIDAYYAELEKEFDIKRLGRPSYFLATNLSFLPNGDIRIDMRSFIDRILTGLSQDGIVLPALPVKTALPPGAKLKKSDRPVLGSDEHAAMAEKPYGRITGQIKFVATVRLDLCQAAVLLAGHMHNPGASHYKMALHAVRYLRDTRTKGITFYRRARPFHVIGPDGQARPPLVCLDPASPRLRRLSPNITLIGAADGDHGGSDEGRKSLTAYVLIYRGTPILFGVNYQGIVAFSTTESEFFSACTLTRRVPSAHQLLFFLSGHTFVKTPILCDNGPAVKVANGEGKLRTSKHIDIRYHVLKEHVALGHVDVMWVPTKQQVVDFMTKPLPTRHDNRLRDSLMTDDPDEPSI